MLLVVIGTGCGVDFDSVAQLNGLRILGVARDKPFAAPGDSVELDMLYHDDVTPARDIELFWLSGCENPPADSFVACLESLGEALAQPPDGGMGDGAAETDDLSQLFRLAVEARLERVPLDAENGVFIGFERSFSIDVSADIISRRPPPLDPGVPAYGLSYVFYAACAGELNLMPTDDGLTLVCLDEQGERVASDGFVVGFASVFSYAEITSANPILAGLSIDGEALDEADYCVGNACGILEADPDDDCEGSVADVEVCEEADDPMGTSDCETLVVEPMLDPESVEIDELVTRDGAERLEEQVWANVHADRGEFSRDLVLLNDATTGFNSEVEIEFIPPATPGPAYIWTVLRDNRGGTEWARIKVCVLEAE